MSWNASAEGTEVAIEFAIGAGDMEAFERLSGDSNPLHTDDGFAESLGFRERVVYGALIVAKISQLIGMNLPGTGGVWTGLRIDFRNPLYVGETATLTGRVSHRSEAARMVAIKLRVETGDRCIATGSAEAVCRGDD